MKRIRLTTKQMLKVLETEPLKLPIVIVMRGMDKAELDKLVKLIKSKRK